MSDALPQQLGQLTFTSRPVETIYLNRDRVREDFVGQIGAVESFTRQAAVNGNVSLGLPVLSAGAAVERNAAVTWTLTDPTAQALVLRTALASRNELLAPSTAKAGSYVVVEGQGFLSQPEMLDSDHRTVVPAKVYDELEAERARQERILRMIDQPSARMWLFTIENPDGIVAAILDNRWVSLSSPSWLVGPNPWSLFARMRGESRAGVPLAAAIHIAVDWAVGA